MAMNWKISLYFRILLVVLLSAQSAQSQDNKINSQTNTWPPTSKIYRCTGADSPETPIVSRISGPKTINIFAALSKRNRDVAKDRPVLTLEIDCNSNAKLMPSLASNRKNLNHLTLEEAEHMWGKPIYSNFPSFSFLLSSEDRKEVKLFVSVNSKTDYITVCRIQSDRWSFCFFK